MVQDELYKLLSDEYGVEKDDLDTTLSIEELAMDSLEYLHMLTLIEVQFGIELTDIDRVSIEYVNDIITTVEKKVAAKQSASAN